MPKLSRLLHCLLLGASIYAQSPAQISTLQTEIQTSGYGLIPSNVPPNEQVVASTDQLGALSVWNFSSGALLYRTKLSTGEAFSTSVSADSSYVAVTTTYDLCLVQTYSGAVVWSKPLSSIGGSISAPCFSTLTDRIYFSNQLGQVCAVSTDGTLVFASQIATGMQSNGGITAISPDGTVAAVTYDGDVFLVNAKTGALIKQIQSSLTGYFYGAFAANETFYTASGSGVVQHWNQLTGAQIGSSINLNTAIEGFAVNPGSTQFAAITGTEGSTVGVYSASTGTLLAGGDALPGNQEATSVQFTPDGGSLLIGGENNNVSGAFMGLYKASTLALDYYFAMPNTTVATSCWTADGTTLLTGDPKTDTLGAWSGQDLHCVSQTFYGGHVNSVAQSSNGTYGAYGLSTGTVELITRASGATANLTAKGMTDVTQVAFSADNSQVLSGGTDATVRAWNLSGTVLGSFKTPGSQVTTLATALTGTSQIIAAGDSSGNIVLWNGSTYKQIETFPKQAQAISRLILSANGQQLLSFSGGTLSVYNVSNTAVVETIGPPTNDTWEDFDLSPDGTSVAMGSGQGLVSIYSLATGTIIGSTYTPQVGIVSLRYSKGGLVLSACVGSTLSQYAGIMLIGNPAKQGAVALSPDEYGTQGGSSMWVRVYVAQPAGSTGAIVGLLSSSSAATVPPSLYIPPGEDYGEFPLNTTTVATPAHARIEALLNGEYAYTTLIILPPILTRVTVSAASVVGGNTLTGTVSLGGPAPSAGSVITLRSSVTGVTVPATVTVAAGATSANFTISTSSVTAATLATVTASYSGVSHSIAFTVAP